MLRRNEQLYEDCVVGNLKYLVDLKLRYGRYLYTIKEELWSGKVRWFEA